MLERVASIENYQGTEADMNDLPACPAGSSFHVITSGDEYTRYADGWVLDLRKARALQRATML
jgi:hypothetical protein